MRDRFQRKVQPIWNDAPRVAGPDYLDENHAFHDAITEASGNEQLLRLTRQLRLTVLMYQLVGMSEKPENIAASLAEHRLIAQAILDRDAEAAQRHVRAHLTRALQVAESMPNGRSRPERRSPHRRRGWPRRRIRAVLSAARPRRVRA